MRVFSQVMPGTCAFCDIPGALARMSPRLSYTCLVVIETFVCLVLTFPKVDVITQYFPYCTLYNEMPGCENFSGYMAVYRFSFAYVVFFLTSSLIMVKTKTMSDIRVRLQEGFWTVKCLILAGLCVFFVLVPSGEFDVVWMVVGMLGSIVFTVVQIFTVLRLTYTLSKHLLSRTEEGSHAACAILFLLTTMIFMTAIVGLCLIVYYYPMCNLNLVFIVGHTMSSIMACLWSLSPCVREINPHSALIPASFVCLFVVFQTWSTISSNPFENCNPYQSETISWMLNLFSLIIALLIITYTSSDWRRKKSTQITDVEDPPQVKTEGAEFDAKKPTLQSTIGKC